MSLVVTDGARHGQARLFVAFDVHSSRPRFVNSDHPASLLDPTLFLGVIRFVILSKLLDHDLPLTVLQKEELPRVTQIRNVEEVVNHQEESQSGATPISGELGRSLDFFLNLFIGCKQIFNDCGLFLHVGYLALLFQLGHIVMPEGFG